MANALSLRAAEMIGQRLRREFYADEASAAIWRSLSQLTHAEYQRRTWPQTSVPRVRRQQSRSGRRVS